MRAGSAGIAAAAAVKRTAISAAAGDDAGSIMQFIALGNSATAKHHQCTDSRSDFPGTHALILARVYFEVQGICLKKGSRDVSNAGPPKHTGICGPLSPKSF